VYTYETRLGSFLRLVQLLGGELLPTTLMAWILIQRDVAKVISTNFLVFVTCQSIFYFLFFTIYELGYFFNDCVAARKEIKPTIRFKNCEELKHASYPRIVIFFLACYFLSILFPFSLAYFTFYCCLALVLSLLHSNEKVEDRGLTYFWTEAFRLIAILSPFIKDTFLMITSVFIIIPEVLRRTLRYLRFKHLGCDRKFGSFDLKVILLSASVIGVFLYQLDPFYLLSLVFFYAPIMAGIALSMKISSNPSSVVNPPMDSSS